jgi:hypothetical protein
MARQQGASSKEARARDCIIRAAIGRMLSAQYDLAEPVPDRLESLLKRIENADQISSGDIARTTLR